MQNVTTLIQDEIKAIESKLAWNTSRTDGLRLSAQKSILKTLLGKIETPDDDEPACRLCQRKLTNHERKSESGECFACEDFCRNR